MTVDLASLSLFVATPSQIITSRKRTYGEWGRGLTLEQYLARDSALDKLEQARDSRLTTWVLAPIKDPETIDFLCSVETYERDGLYSLPGSMEAEICKCYGIASVFTPSFNRKKGYARHMMSLLHWLLSFPSTLGVAKFPTEWGMPPKQPRGFGHARFSVLYGDVGEKFYHVCSPTPDTTGWQVISPIGTLFDVKYLQQHFSASTNDAMLYESKWQLLGESSALDLWERDAEQMKKDLSIPSTKARVCILPNRGVAAYLNRRASVFETDKSELERLKWGTELRVEDGTLAFVTWAPDPQSLPPPNPTILAVSRVRANPQTFPVLLQAMSDYCASQNPPLDKIEIWNVPEELRGLCNQYKGVTGRRSEHLNSVKVYGTAENDDNIEWLFNERSVYPFGMDFNL